MVQLTKSSTSGRQWRSLLFVMFIFVSVFFVLRDQPDLMDVGMLLPKNTVLQIDDPACNRLPIISPSGSVFFLNAKVGKHPSPEGVKPPFHIGSRHDRVTRHMGADLAHYKLIGDIYENKKKRIALDIGANQGFFTYFLATLGFQEVHAFEISADNFVSLQHGQYFNPKETSDRVSLYPMGLSSKTGRIGMRGGDYEGFLTSRGDDEGPILSVTTDCFVYHTQMDLDMVDFVKIDVEGFEIAVLQGATNSLLRVENNSPRIRAMLMEVGPSRWKRAETSFQDGVAMLRDHLAAKLFQKSYILIRLEGPFAKSCPRSLATETLSAKDPVTVIPDKVERYEIKLDEWEPVLSKMNTFDGDCNFWFTNDD